jgi:hypothetical protein
MFYKQFSAIISVLNPEFVENFDFWLATLPTNNQRNITASVVSSRLGVKYSLAESILRFAEKQGILEKYYLVKCSSCEQNLCTITKNEIADVLVNSIYCHECEENKKVTIDDIYSAYKVILQPDFTEDEIASAIEKRLNQDGFTEENFTEADSLSNEKYTLYEAFYDPSESAYKKFKELRDKLDLDYGKNTTEKGKALETLVLELFNQIRYVQCTNDVKTKTNQFDCTALCGFNTGFLSIFRYLSPYFLIECKNEPKKKPNNTYCNKILSIMDTNEAQFGIVFGRVNAAKTCFQISREHYLKHSASKKQQIVITCCDDDLDFLIDKKVNLLKYLEYKIFSVTTNSVTATYEMFEKSEK